MQIDLYIFRHGQTEKNVLNLWQGCTSDSELNNKGKKQASALAKKVSALNLTAIYSSSLLRARQTAEAIIDKQSRALSLIIKNDLRECDFGIEESKSINETCEKYGTEYVNNLLFPTYDTWDESFPKAESKHQVFNRVNACLEEIIAENIAVQNAQIGIVCHAGVLSALQCGLALQKVSFDNCSTLHLSYDTDTKCYTQIYD